MERVQKRHIRTNHALATIRRELRRGRRLGSRLGLHRRGLPDHPAIRKQHAPHLHALEINRGEETDRVKKPTEERKADQIERSFQEANAPLDIDRPSLIRSAKESTRSYMAPNWPIVGDTPVIHRLLGISLEQIRRPTFVEQLTQ